MNTRTQKHGVKPAMTLLELTVVILVLMSLTSMLFVGARAWMRGSDRSANILNIRNAQYAMRGEQNMKRLIAGDVFDQSDCEEYMQYPPAVNGAIGPYGNAGVITTQSATPATDWNHIWLIPGAVGLPGESYGHDSYDEVTGW